MAGSFGHESGHYDVSIKAGEHALLPKVRSAPADRLIIASGFSWRERIAQSARRPAVHLSEVLAMALHQRAPGPPAASEPPAAAVSWKALAAAAASAAAAFAAANWVRRR